MRLRAAQPTISLFSFQDIITSVTAILILIVLILAMELVTRKMISDAATPSATARSLAVVVADLESLVASLAAAIPVNADATPTALMESVPDRELQTLRDQVERHRSRVEAARRVAVIAKSGSDEAKAALTVEQSQARKAGQDERDAGVISHNARQLAETNAAEEGRLEKKRQELEGRPLPGQQLVFRRPEGADRRQWLLEVYGSHACVLELGSGNPRTLTPGSGADSEIARWINSLDVDSSYVLVLVRPSGIDLAQELSQMIAASEVPYGIDFIGEDQPVYDGSDNENRSSRGRSEGD